MGGVMKRESPVTKMVKTLPSTTLVAGFWVCALVALKNTGTTLDGSPLPAGVLDTSEPQGWQVQVRPYRHGE